MGHNRVRPAAIGVLYALLAAVLIGAPAYSATIPPHSIVVYDDSWDEPALTSAAASPLASLPDYITIVDLAFVRPDLVYPGQLDLSHTGLEYRFTGNVLRDAIAMLKARRPDAKVLVSVGGAAYRNWRALNETAVAKLVHDLGADGADIDFEPSHPDCGTSTSGSRYCATDPVWPMLVQRFRTVLPRPAILTAAVWSVGAYGEGVFKDAEPSSHYTGLMLRFLRSPVAAELDMLSIDAYDAGPEFDPTQAFRAYRAVWAGPLALGLAVARRGGSGPFYSEADAELLARQVSRDPEGAMMVYPLLAEPEGARSDTLPNGRGLASSICRGMGLRGCATTEP